MEVRITIANETRIVNTSSEEFVLWFSQTLSHIPEWNQRFVDSPGNMRELEHEMARVFNDGVGMLIAGFLGTTSKDPSVVAQVKDIQQSSDTPLRAPIHRTIFIRLLCGIILSVTVGDTLTLTATISVKGNSIVENINEELDGRSI